MNEFKAGDQITITEATVDSCFWESYYETWYNDGTVLEVTEIESDCVWVTRNGLDWCLNLKWIESAQPREDK